MIVWSVRWLDSNWRGRGGGWEDGLRRCEVDFGSNLGVQRFRQRIVKLGFGW